MGENGEVALYYVGVRHALYAGGYADQKTALSVRSLFLVTNGLAPEDVCIVRAESATEALSLIDRWATQVDELRATLEDGETQ